MLPASQPHNLARVLHKQNQAVVAGQQHVLSVSRCAVPPLVQPSQTRPALLLLLHWALHCLQAFAAVGTMEGSWYTATGTPRSFSEQQLIDCAWPHGPHGCDGGDYQVSTHSILVSGEWDPHKGLRACTAGSTIAVPLARRVCKKAFDASSTVTTVHGCPAAEPWHGCPADLHCRVPGLCRPTPGHCCIEGSHVISCRPPTPLLFSTNAAGLQVRRQAGGHRGNTGLPLRGEWHACRGARPCAEAKSLLLCPLGSWAIGWASAQWLRMRVIASSAAACPAALKHMPTCNALASCLLLILRALPHRARTTTAGTTPPRCLVTLTAMLRSPARTRLQ